jgi:hypothetical protein
MDTTMTILHHRVHIIAVDDPLMRKRLKQVPAMRRALVMELDETHWLIDGQELSAVESACAKAGITMHVVTHAE